MSKVISFIQAIGITAAIFAAVILIPILGGLALLGIVFWIAYVIIQDEKSRNN